MKPTIRLLRHLTWWDLVAQYLGSWLGLLWNVLLPAVVIGVYLAVFELSPRFRFGGWDAVGGYGVNLVAGLLPWLLFQEGVSRGAGVFVDQRHLLSQVPVPPVLFPLATVGSAAARHLVGVLLVVGLLAATGVTPGASLLALPAAAVVVLLLTAGASLLTAVGTVLHRDIAPAVTSALLPLFFTTPVVYPTHVLPGPLRVLVDLNPLTPVVLAYRDALVGGRWPRWPDLAWSAAVGATLAFGGLLAVRRYGPEIAERVG